MVKFYLYFKKKIFYIFQISAVQHVDVCMFSNGKFKNIVAEVDVEKQVSSNESFHGTYPMLPIRGATKNWIAVEGALFNSSSHDTNLVALNSKLASTAPRGPQSTDEKNVFAIYVSYYVKVKLTLSSMGGEVSLKLPFILGNVDVDGSCTDENKRKRLASSGSSGTGKMSEDYMTVKDIGLTKSGDHSSGIGSHEEDDDKEDDVIRVESQPSGKTKLEKFREMKLSEGLSDSVDAVTEELSHILHNNCDKSRKLSRSDSSKSNLAYSEDMPIQLDTNGGVASSSNNVIKAQVHCEEKQDDTIKGAITSEV